MRAKLSEPARLRIITSPFFFASASRPAGGAGGEVEVARYKLNFPVARRLATKHFKEH